MSTLNGNCVGLVPILKLDGEIWCWDGTDEAPQLEQDLADGAIRIEEDHPLWDCHNMGNGICGVVEIGTPMTELPHTGGGTELLPFVAFFLIIGLSFTRLARKFKRL